MTCLKRCFVGVLFCLTLFGVPLTAYAQGTEYDDCKKADIHDITGELINAGIIYERHVWVPAKYTNGNTCIDKDWDSFHGYTGRYISGNHSNGGYLSELVLRKNAVDWGGINPDAIRNGDYNGLYQTQVALGSNEVQVWYGIKTGWGEGDNWHTWWVGARGSIRYWGFKQPNGRYLITHIVAQTKCTAGDTHFGWAPSWKPESAGGVVSAEWWGDYPAWGWDGGVLCGGWEHKCPGHTVYTYDVNPYVNGSKTGSTLPAVFDVDIKNAKNLNDGFRNQGRDMTDYYKPNSYRSGTEAWVYGITPKDGYVYVGENSSYVSGATGAYRKITADTEVQLPFKTKYSIAYQKGLTDQSVSMPGNTNLVWDDNVTLPTVKDIRGRKVDIIFDENKGKGSSTPVSVTDVDTSLPVSGWTINSNNQLYRQGTSLTAPKFSGRPNGKVTATMTYSSKTYSLPVTSRTGYDFLGWYTAKSGGSKVDSISVDPATTGYNKTLYAHWNARTYTLTYKKNNPSTALVGEGDISLSKTSQTTKYDDAWGPLATVSKPGYVFLGWYTKPTGGTRVTADTICHGDLTVYAHWRPIQYTVRFHPNKEHGEGTVTGTMASVTLTYDKAANLPLNQYSKTTFVPSEDEGGNAKSVSSVFTGWSTIAETFNASLKDGAKVLNMTKKDGDVIDLYAIWDDSPKFVIVAYPDRYFTIEEAQRGDITEEELIRTVVTDDRESGRRVTVRVVNYDAEEFKSVTDDTTISVRYEVKDTIGNKTYLNINVYISRNGKMPEEQVTYLRSLGETYLDTTSELGGLAKDSRWKLDEAYQGALSDVYDDSSAYDLHLGKRHLQEIRDYVEEQGFGNSLSSGEGLDGVWGILGE